MRTLLERLRALTVYSVDPEAAGGNGGVAAPVAPDAPPSEDGTPQGQPQEDGFWGRFPNVPLEQRALLEPHLKQVQAYVTKQQQRYAPFKDYTDDQVQGLARFASEFDANPLGMWLTLAQSLQENGQIHPELDLEALASYAQGQFDDDDQGQGNPQQQITQPQTEGEDMPEWARQIMQRFEEQEQREAQSKQQQQQQMEDRLFAKKLGELKNNLKGAGLPDDLYSDKDLTAFIVANQGDFAAAEQAILNVRTSLLKGFVEKKTEDNDPEIVDGGPRARPTPGGRRAPRDAFEGASRSAEQFLRQSISGNA